MLIDLRPDHLAEVTQILARHVPNDEVWAFGSRVVGGAKKHSDLDLVVVRETSLDLVTLAQLRDAFSESNLPFSVDVLDGSTLSEAFRQIVEAAHVVLQVPRGA